MTSEARIKYYINKIKWGTEEELPMCPGEAIKAMIKEYDLQAIAYGFDGNVIGVETQKYKILWRDTGTRIDFLGHYNKKDKTYTLPKKEPKAEHPIFETYEELRKEIRKRGYENIKGLKAKITSAEYQYFLEVLPPLRMKDNSFYMGEFLTGDLTNKFYKEGNNYFCEVVDFQEDNKDISEEEFDEMR